MQSHRVTPAVGLVACLLATAPAPAADPPPDADDIDTYPVAQGRFTTPTDFYWVYFRTPDGRSCGIGPNGGPVGSTRYPSTRRRRRNRRSSTAGARPNTAGSNTTTFTRDVDVLPEGHRLENWGASCGIGNQGTVTCRTYDEHGFMISTVHGVLW